MDQDETLRLFKKGRDAWNDWARKKLRERQDLIKGDQPITLWRDEARADFRTRQFDHADFSHFVFPAEANFARAVSLGEANFAHARFFGDANFERAIFKRSVTFQDAKFHKQANFSHAEILIKPSNFSEVIFAGQASFTNTDFQEQSAFQQTCFLNAVDFSHATFSKASNFDRCRFGDDANVKSVTFRGVSIWTNARFRNSASFGEAIFVKGARFSSATFEGAANFVETHFEENVYFRRTVFLATANFSGTEFQNALFQLANFEHSEFAGAARFERARFGGLANFRNSHFQEAANFNAIRAESSFDMAGATFYCDVPNFIQAHFPEAPRLDHIHVPTVAALRRASAPVGTYATARYRALKRLAIQGHDYDRELQFFADELLSQQQTVWSARNWFVDLYGLISDFGRSITRPLAGWLWTAALFAGLYAGVHDMRDVPSDNCEGSSPTLLSIFFSVQRGLVFPGLGQSQQLDRVHSCLFGTATMSADGSERVIPDIDGAVAVAGMLQSLISALLIFLILLAVRNRFRIK